MSMKKTNIWWIVVVVWMLVIFAGSSIPSSNIPSGHWFWPVLIHTLEYLILTVLILLALKQGSEGSVKSATYFIAIAFAVFYGITDEAHQLYVAGRVPDMLDLATDCFGAVFGSIGFRLFHTQKLKR